MCRSAFLSCLFAAAASWAADGIVVDPSNRPVPNARVECSGASTRTGDDGRFSLPGVTSCRAVVTALGFAAATAELSAATPARVRLSIAPQSELVVVTATRRETSVEEAAMAATVVTAAELESRATPAVADVLRSVPGVQITRYGRPGSLTQVFGRGGERTGMLVMVDGVPANDPGGEVNLAGFSTTGVDRIEVVRGPESALFGAEASSGVVQLFTHRGDPENRLPHGSVTYERGSFSTDRWAASLAGGSGSRFDYSLAAEQFHTAGEYANDYFRDTTGSANAGFRVSSATQLRAVVRMFDAAIGAPNQIGYGLFDRDAWETTRDSTVSFTLDDVRGRNFVQRASFYYHRSNDLFTDPAGDGPYDVAALVRDVPGRVPHVYFEGLTNPAAPVPAGLRLVTQSVYLWPSDPYLSLSSREAFDYQGTLTHAGGAAVFGYTYERQDAEVTGRNVDRGDHGLFLYDQKTVARRLFLSGGVRLDRNSAFGTRLTPRAGAGYLLAGAHGLLSSTYLRAGAGIGINEPSLLENFARDPYFTGNPALRPEKTRSVEAGLVQEWFARRVRTEVSALDNSFRDLIVFVSSPTASTWQNIDASRARGLEFSGTAKITSVIFASGSYTRLWTRITRSTTPDSLFTGVGQELPHRAGNSGAVSLTCAPRRWTLQAGALLIGERQDPDQYVFGVNRNRGYQDVYASGSFRLSKNLVPFARIGNALDLRYQEVLGYPAPSRNFNGGMRIEW